MFELVAVSHIIKILIKIIVNFTCMKLKVFINVQSFYLTTQKTRKSKRLLKMPPRRAKKSERRSSKLKWTPSCSNTKTTPSSKNF